MATSSLPAQPATNGWTSVDFNTCRECISGALEHFDELLECLHKLTGVPDKKFIYRQLTAAINEKLNDEENRKKEIYRQLRRSINEQLIETSQHICQNRKNKCALRSIANELSLLPDLLLIDKQLATVSFKKLDRFVDFFGNVELSEYGRRAIQSSERHSSAKIRGRNLYDWNEVESSFEIRLEIEQFQSEIWIGICTHDASPSDMDDKSNTFPVDPSRTSREGDIFHLLIDVHQYEIQLWNEHQPIKYQNNEPKKRRRTISERKCPLPWRFLVKLSSKGNHIRIVY